MSKERQQHKLLPCPFCGHTAQTPIAEEDERHRPNIVCPCCGVRVYGMTLAKYKWNMRAE